MDVFHLDWVSWLDHNQSDGFLLPHLGSSLRSNCRCLSLPFSSTFTTWATLLWFLLSPVCPLPRFALSSAPAPARGDFCGDAFLSNQAVCLPHVLTQHMYLYSKQPHLWPLGLFVEQEMVLCNWRWQHWGNLIKWIVYCDFPAPQTDVLF